MTDKELYKDLLGNKIIIGDKVLFMQIKYRDFMEGVIETMAEKSALISHEKTNTCKTESRQHYGQIISLSAIDRGNERLQSENTLLQAKLDKAVEDISRRWICKSCTHLTKHQVWGDQVWGYCPKRVLIENEDFNETCASFEWRGLEDNNG